MNIRTMTVAALALGAGLGCTATVGGGGVIDRNVGDASSGGPPSPPVGDDAGVPGSSNDAASSGDGQAGCTTTQASPVHARLLSPSQYDNTVQDLLKIGGNPAETYYVAGGESAQLDPVAVGHRADAAA
ncbi:MAG: hypothetical protein M3O36_08830, partial [Myxococcota bacterium]|nr:hypothetical protein [Myxococcota bacterium]